MASKIEDGLVLSGYQKKLKTMKKKFFVLHKKTLNSDARLEYYDSEKKFNQRSEPKRVIYLKDCFNINRRFDTKHKFVLALSSRDGGFGIVLDTETDLRTWLDNLLSLQRGNDNISDQIYPPFDHVWQIVVQKKGLSDKVGLVGSYHCCLSSKSLTFMCIGPEKSINGEERINKVEILLTTVRRCGHAPPQGIFYMELGRQSVLGSGELWMETEDAAIAKNMHDMILSAMTKPEPNMNLTNSVCQTKHDINIEPMRKRSSSANEASKPINVLKKRQNPIEIKSSISPHKNSYGRERCDSLPSRNRTISECSNQSYLQSNHTFRSNTISGFRPYSCQRHSNSPPLSTPMRCSESEESSISIDELDDNGSSFNSYRYNTRSSKGVIPEENVDDYLINEQKLEKVAENMDNYIPMTPVKSTNEIVNANQLNQFKQNVLKEEYICKVQKNAGDEALSFDFPEHTSERLGKYSEIETDSQNERPTRTYSIGSKTEHIVISKRLGHVNEVEQSLPRVRAFSVGSRLKIPRCDLQRGVLFSKVCKEQNANGSNSNITEDLSVNAEKSGLNGSRDKKSTSAPLLNLKSHMNSERMSDLMEIDFSKITRTGTAAQVHPLLLAKQATKSTQSSMQNKLLNANASKSFTGIKQDELPTRRIVTSSCGSTDEGYLEMKPVGNTFSNSSIADMDNQLDIHKNKNISSAFQSITLPKNDNTKMDVNVSNASTEISQIPQGPSSHAQPLNVINSLSTADNKADYKTQTSVESSNIKNNITKQIINNSKMNLGDDYINLKHKNLENNFQNLQIDASIIISNKCISEERKLTHSISNEDYTQNLNKSILESPESGDTGYKILQIKSDSSLTSAKKIQRPSYKDKFDRQPKLKLLENVNRINNKVNTTAHTKCNLLVKTPELPTNMTAYNATKSNVHLTNDLNAAASRPPSVTFEQELHYASLDLPQCSDPIITKARKEIACEPSPVAIPVQTTNSYAKIDFDHSDSSSSSSKICNV